MGGDVGKGRMEAQGAEEGGGIPRRTRMIMRSNIKSMWRRSKRRRGEGT